VHVAYLVLCTYLIFDSIS